MGAAFATPRPKTIDAKAIPYDEMLLKL